MYCIRTMFVNCGSSTSCVNDLSAALDHAFNIYMETDYLGRRTVVRVEVLRKNDRGGWTLLAI